MISALLGFAAGGIHVLTGPDHLAAVAPLTADKPAKSWKIGLWWGIGHTGSVWLIGILLFFLRDLIPIEGLSDWGEKMVGAVLIGLGIWGLRRAFKPHVHDHGDTRHAHFFFRKDHTHTSLGIGMLHGVAGSSHFIALLPALALPTIQDTLFYIIAFGIGTIVAMVGFSWLLGFSMKKFFMDSLHAVRWIQVSFSTIAIALGIFWVSVT